MRVECYWNLHKKIWSIRSCETGRVTGHSNWVVLRDVQWVVRPAGRDKVRREGRKNVHAFARGYLAYDMVRTNVLGRGEEVRYNPYTMDSFQTADGSPAYKSLIAILDGHGGKAHVKAWDVRGEPSPQKQGAVQQACDTHRQEEGE